ncbi:MAG TPA: ABC transporter substrate-binding protein [Acidimicrobiia bacterium]
MRRRFAGSLGFVALVAASFVGAPPGGAAGSDDFPVIVKADNGKVEIEERPERIVSLSASATEILFAIGAGDQVVAVDEQSDYPAGVPTTDLSGYEPNIEAIAGYEPDLVVVGSPGVAEPLERLDIPVIEDDAPTRLKGAYRQFRRLGKATGHRDEADDAVAGMKQEIADLVEGVPDRDAPATAYWELDDTYYSVTSETFIGQVLTLAGLTNIADEADDTTDYPQLTSEFIVSADPDFILLADTECCGQSAETVADRPGWADLTAVRDGGVVELDDDVASRWGPRVVELFEVIVESTTT